MRFWLAALIGTLATSALAEPRQFANVIYDPAPAWDSYGTNDELDATVLFYDAPTDDCEFCKIYIARSSPRTGTLTDFLRASTTRFVEEDNREGVSVYQEPQITRLGSRDVAMMSIKDGSDFQMLIAYDLPDRYELVAFEGNAYDEEELQVSTGVLQAYGIGLFERLKFVSEGAPPLLPKARPGELAGLWWGWSIEHNLGLDGMLRTDVDHRRIVFWPDGHFLEATPPLGVTAPPDHEALLQTHFDDFGIYQVLGGRLTLTFATGEKEVLTAEEGGWSDGAHKLDAVEVLPDGTALDGFVSSFFYTGFTPGSGLEGGVSSGSETTYHPDGAYEGSSFGGAFANFVQGGDYTGGFSTSSGDETGGTYVVKDGLLIQTPNDGSPPRVAIIYRVDDDILIEDRYLKTEEE